MSAKESKRKNKNKQEEETVNQVHLEIEEVDQKKKKKNAKVKISSKDQDQVKSKTKSSNDKGPKPIEHCIPWREFIPEHLSVKDSGIQTREVVIKQTGKKLKTFEINLEYKYGDDDRGYVIGRFNYYGPKLVSKRGIKIGVTESGQITKSITGILDISRPKLVEFRQFQDILHQRCTELVNEKRADVGIVGKKKVELRELYITPSDEKTEEPIPGKSPLLYAKIIDIPPNPPKSQGFRARFVGPNKKDIDYELLESMTITFKPKYGISSIFIGGNDQIIRQNLAHAVVRDIKEMEQDEQMSETLDKYSSNPELVDNFEAQMAQIMAKRQDKLVKKIDTGPSSSGSKVNDMGENNDDSESTDDDDNDLPPIPSARPIPSRVPALPDNDDDDDQ